MADEIQRFEVEDEYSEFLHADPEGGWVAFRDLSKLRQQWETELLSDEAKRAAAEAFERLPDGTQFRERLKVLPEYGEMVVTPSELATSMLEAALATTHKTKEKP